MKIPQNFDRWMFDYLEGNLSLSEKETFEQFLAQNPSFEPDADAWQNAIIPIDTIVYPNQKNLERKKRFAGWYSWSAAAILLLLGTVGGYIAMNTTTINNVGTNLAQFTRSNNLEQPKNIHSNTSLALNQLNYATNANQSNSTINTLNNSQLNNSTLEENVGIENQNNYFNQNSTQFLANNNLQTRTENSFEETADNSVSNLNESDFYANTSEDALEQEQVKYTTNKYNAHYKLNPNQSNTSFDLSKKNNLKLNSFGSVTKRIYRKIEKMLGYPVGLVNLRDPNIILPENSLISFNPGFVGGMLVPRFETKYRNQWLGESMNSHKAQFSFDNYVNELRGGFGFALNSETYNNGAFGNYSVEFAYSPKIVLSKNVVFEPGVKVSLGVLTGNTAKFSENKKIELERGMILNNLTLPISSKIDKLWYKDYGLGFVLNTKWFYTGFSADNLSRHYANVYANESGEPVKSPILFNGILGADYESANRNMSISPFLTFRQFGASKEAWAGANYRIKHFTIAGAYSTNKDYTASIGMKFNSFKLVYQYDKTYSLLSNKQIGSHSIGIRFNGNVKNSRFKY